MNVQQHDDARLADHGSWEVVHTSARVAEQSDLLRRMGVGYHPGGHGLDLGCGPGYQSLALNCFGYWVTAIDSSPELLDELERHRDGMDVQTVLGDLRRFRDLRLPPMDVIVCLGDALSRLDGRNDLVRLFADLALQIKPDGRLILGIRMLRFSVTEMTALLAAAGFTVNAQDRSGMKVVLMAMPVR